MRGLYVLNENDEPIPEPDVERWGKASFWRHKHIAEDTIGGVRVSTVFLGIDHNHFDIGPPVLWETMIFGGRFDDWQDRYTSRADAVRGHAIAVGLVTGDVLPQ